MKPYIAFIAISFALLGSSSVVFAADLSPSSGYALSEGLFSNMTLGAFPNSDTLVVIESPTATKCAGDVRLNLGESYTLDELATYTGFSPSEILEVGTWVTHTAVYSGSCVIDDVDDAPYTFELLESEPGATTTFATSSASIQDVVFGQAIQIVLLSLMFAAFIFNSIKKPWR